MAQTAAAVKVRPFFAYENQTRDNSCLSRFLSRWIARIWSDRNQLSQRDLGTVVIHFSSSSYGLQ
jgi:hypothetical protein